MQVSIEASGHSPSSLSPVADAVPVSGRGRYRDQDPVVNELERILPSTNRSGTRDSSGHVIQDLC